MLIDLTLSAISTLCAIPACTLFMQVTVASFSKSNTAKQSNTTATRELRTCVLIPAHNESLGIAETLHSLLTELTGNTRVLVVADNCTDSTAQIARTFPTEHGKIEVIERFHETLRGKGYALDFGIRHLESDPPEVVVILDADCQVEEGCIQTLAWECVVSNKPIQALYLMVAPAPKSIKSQVAEFAWLVKNQVRPSGDCAMGFPCLLTGSGMAFPWKQIQSAHLHTGHIVEDMALGIELSKSGAPPRYLGSAVVKSRFPITGQGIKTQRTRWEHGHLGMIISEVPNLLQQGFRNGDLKLLALAANLTVPPLALFSLLVTALVILSAGNMLLGGRHVSIFISLLDTVLFGSSVLLAWWRFGRKVIPFFRLLSVPVYVLTKVPIYLMFVFKRQTKWVRSNRNNE